MRRSFAIIATVTLAALLASAGTAGAMRAIRLSPAGEITKIVPEFTIRAFGGEVTIICRLTMRGRVLAIIEKSLARVLPEGRIGRINTATTAGCRTIFGTMAEVTILVEPGTPFDLRYEAFQGVLPEITGLTIRKLGFALEVVEPLIIGTCLFRGPLNLVVTFPPVEGAGGGRYNPEAFQTPNALPTTTGGLCPESVQISGAGGVTPAQSAFLLN